jgi:hypothetical protein
MPSIALQTCQFTCRSPDALRVKVESAAEKSKKLPLRIASAAAASCVARSLAGCAGSASNGEWKGASSMFDEMPQVALIDFAELPGLKWAARLSNHDP